jgi:glycosyltransferase involved in cell wall biosynthesis
VLRSDSLFARDLNANLAVVAFLKRALGGVGRIDVIHAHAAVPSLIGLLFSRGCLPVPPVIQTMHGWGIAKSLRDAQTDVAVLDLVDQVVVPAETSRELLRSLGVRNDRITVVPYGVPAPERWDEIAMDDTADDDVLAAIRTERHRGGFVMCCVGTLGVRKNQRLLIEALPLVEHGEHVRCVLVGDGDQLEHRTRARELGVADRVIFAGYRRDARRLAREADLFVLPSRSEGQPLAILEAFCDGVPVLASRIRELTELVKDGVNGLLFEPEDPASLAEAIDRVRRLDPTARALLRANARHDYQRRHTVAAMVEGYSALYRSAQCPEEALASCS